MTRCCSSLSRTTITRPLARQRVTVFDYPDGRLAIKHKGLELPYRTFDKRQRVNQAAVVENKRLGPVLAYIAERQKELDMGRSKKAPSRRGQGPEPVQGGLSWPTRRSAAEQPRPARPRCSAPGSQTQRKTERDPLPRVTSLMGRASDFSIGQ